MKKKTKARGLILSNFKSHSRTTVFKRVWYWQKKKKEANVSMEQIREPRKIGSHKYSQLIFEKGAKAMQQAKLIFSTNGSGTTGHSNTKELSWIAATPYTKVNSKWSKD